MKLKLSPSWVKPLFITSLILILIFACLATFIFTTSVDLSVLAGFLYLVYIGIIIGMWLLGFLNKYLVIKNVKWLANILSSIPIIAIVGYFGGAFIWQILYYPELLGSFSVNSFFLIPVLIIIIYSIISLVLINKKN
ncbi:MAG: hypothetical protein KAS02_01055 [Candidatus Pacebacteria bacterium]|nr:hypothetical protein [Candidatus Paceibacterota bacterium]